jgi:hypothetical protein
MEIAFFDGTQLIEEWDSFEQGALPAGIEIRLTIYEPSFADSPNDEPKPHLTGEPSYRENELVEYRRFVRLPNISPAQPAEALMPIGGGGGESQRGGGGPGENGRGGQNQGGRSNNDGDEGGGNG